VLAKYQIPSNFGQTMASATISLKHRINKALLSLKTTYAENLTPYSTSPADGSFIFSTRVLRSQATNSQIA